jgi:hypothetical protein
LRKRDPPRPVESGASRKPHKEEGIEKKNTDKKKKTISKQVPEHLPSRRRAYGGCKAATIDVQTSGHVEDQGAEKEEQKKIADQKGSRQPNAHDQRQTDQHFDPREKKGCEVDQQIWEDLIVVNDLGKRNRVEDLVVAGIDKDSSQEKTRQDKEDVDPTSLGRLILREEGQIPLGR